MSCETCKDIYEVDEIQPDCETGRGCPIPPLGPDEARILEIRDKIMRLRDLIPAHVILRMYGVTRDDLDLLTVIEEELKADSEETNGN